MKLVAAFVTTTSRGGKEGRDVLHSQMLHCHIEPHLGVGLSMVMNNGLT